MARMSSPISRKGIKPADRFEIIEREDGILLRPAGPDFSELAGTIPALKGRERVDLETVIQEARKDYADELARRFDEE